MPDYYKIPRVYVNQDLIESDHVTLDDGALHYLKNVMRVKTGDKIRMFNGRTGEFVGRIEESRKKAIGVTVEKKIRAQKESIKKIHLLFAPLKKERMDFLIEKAVELGVTDFHPVLSQNADIRKINIERITAQIIEAAEQSERMDIPALYAAQDLFKNLAAWNADVPLLAALERMDATPLRDYKTDQECGLLIGPAGGFTSAEKEKIANLKFVKPVSLGDNILRSETAAIAALSLLAL